MTNEEIRNPIMYEIYNGGYNLLKGDVDKNVDTVQVATRKDERERVIKEIEDWLSPKLTAYLSELAVENYKSEILSKLNSLKGE